MLNIVIPMAGKGNRFIEAGHSVSKPFIPIHGTPMIKLVIDNIRPKIPHRLILVCLNEDLKKYQKELKSLGGDIELIGIEKTTQGQVCTVLEAKDLIDNDHPLMTVNSDQFINFSIDKYLSWMDQQNLDGLIMTMKSTNPKWSFVKIDEDGLALKTAEKEVISDHATVGIYNFRKGSDLIRSAEKLIDQNLRVNNEFYICPCFNFLIEEGKKIGVYSIGEVNKAMYGLGTPKDLEFFIKNRNLNTNENFRT
jgi:NDP-sugar pyrophosphorylase family protein